MSKQKVGLDTCSILHLLDPKSEWYLRVNNIYEQAKKGQIQLFVSEVSVAECAKLRLADGTSVSQEVAAKQISQFLNSSFIERRGLTRRESEFAAHLIRVNDLGGADAMIAATAVYYDVEVLYTSDGCTGKRKAGKLLTAKEIVTPCGKRMLIRVPPE